MGIYIYLCIHSTYYIYISYGIQVMSLTITLRLSLLQAIKVNKLLVVCVDKQVVVLCFVHATSSLNHAGYMQATKASLDR